MKKKHVHKEIDLTKAATAYVLIRTPAGVVEIGTDAETVKKLEVSVTTRVPTDEHLPALTTHRNDRCAVIRAEQLTAEKIELIPDPPGPSASGVDLGGQHAILSPKMYRGPIAERVVLCQGGSGCMVNSMGTKVYGKYVYDDAHVFEFRRGDFTRLANPDEVAAAKVRRAELRAKADADAGVVEA